MENKELLSVTIVFRNGYEYTHVYEKSDFIEDEARKLFGQIHKEFTKQQSGILKLNKPEAIYRLQDAISVRFEGHITQTTERPSIGFLANSKNTTNINRTEP